ncbi:dimethyl sulfoxide reductase, anaerobic, subunit C [Vibrio ichthyoenteri ATCC 700023]|uniref:Dimethyl sulfoxide reductase, anaerobic, subunit C n=1 Tax=Vibrio ichthyoenteri ATCC 700023 TaxID=870968 RepID=F9S6L7_9VIBR|nr:DmsC/YnfH family molybdoenzyme membrane anchor subunit [Vibrio ichthyoenteri]EGU32674.1 dimethyl sulfoxide reductase, anaerobic, subunit C [Vibrio ichthyoenteri ATCC 700023]
MSQLSLVFFTVLAQSAAGMFIALGLLEMFFKPNNKAMTRSFMAVFVLLGVGAIASVTHLGQPLRMFNVMFGLAHGSALSLEIVGLSLFGGAAAAYTGMRLFNLMPAMQKLVLPVAMILGVVFILAIANVYTLTTVPTWNTSFTAFQFLMTAGAVGPIAAALMLRAQKAEMGEMNAVEDSLAAGVALFGTITLMGYAAYLVWLGQLDIQHNPFDVVGYAFNLVMLRVGLLLLGMLLIIVSALKRCDKAMFAALIAFIFVLVSEFMGRAFFYDVYISASAGM